MFNFEIMDHRLKKIGPRYKELYFEQKGLCGICEKLMDPTDMSRDHIIPKSKGGKSRHPSQPDKPRSNIRLTHTFCNTKRGNKY